MICIMFNFNEKPLSSLTQADGYRIFGDDENDAVDKFIESKVRAGAVCIKFESVGAYKLETKVVQY